MDGTGSRMGREGEHGREREGAIRRKGVLNESLDEAEMGHGSDGSEGEEVGWEQSKVLGAGRKKS